MPLTVGLSSFLPFVVKALQFLFRKIGLALIFHLPVDPILEDPVNNTPGFADTFAAEGQWTIDNGWSAGAGAYFMYQTKAVPGLWGGVGVYGYWNQDNGWGLGGLPIVGAGNPGELNFGGAEVGFGTSGAIYFGLGGKYGGAGLILDPSRFGNLLNPNANDQQIDRLVYGSHRRRRRGVGNPCP